MAERTTYVGIDLGTTNSTAATYDGEKITVVRNAQGGPLTPSVVRIDGRGTVSVGGRARRFLESDPANTRGEFKRLMGTNATLPFPAAKLQRRPEELAAEVLKALRADVRDQTGVLPTMAAISVPALFELPQSRATSEAARLAGFERVELIQEPIASALAAGWSAELEPGHWLVYDMGGGTFDVSLLETSDGFLRVVDHDGDNYLGGRDLDAAIVDWVLAELASAGGPTLERADPACAVPLRKLKAAAEEAKIEAARGAAASLVVPALVEGVDVDLVLEPETFARLAEPLIERSLMVCRRLLERHGVASEQLQRVVLVGGPTATPRLRERVAAALGAPFAEDIDPMTVVAQGAALFAATAGLDARGARPPSGAQRALVLRFPSVAPTLAAHVIGRVADLSGSPRIERVRLTRAADGRCDAPASVEPDGSFIAEVQLLPRRANVFRVEGLSGETPVEVAPAELTIVHGVTVGDPPLSRTIGVALATNQVHAYFDRGTPLPARGVFTHRTVEALSAGSAEDVLRVPIVQGEFLRADLCRLVGAIEIRCEQGSRPLPAGSDVEVTIELDRGGRLTARAFVASLGRVFEDAVKLLVPDVSAEALAESLESLRSRLSAAQGGAFRAHRVELVKRLAGVEDALDETTRDLESAKGGDQDAAQRARRALLEAEGELDDVEIDLRFDQVADEAIDDLASAAYWVGAHGTDTEKALLEEQSRSAQSARKRRRPRELDRALKRIRDLRTTAYLRAPDIWPTQFAHVESRLDRASDVPKAHRLVAEGRQARAKEDHAALERVTRALWGLLPPDEVERQLGHYSGVR